MMCGLIDLNIGNYDTDEVSTSSSSSGSPPASLVGSGDTPVVCCLELWHACAGPLISLPKKGNAVVYCPQGHLEQLQFAGEFRTSGEFSIAPHVFCRVVDVKLHAEAGNDDVYAQVSLIQDPQLEQKWREGVRGAEYADDDNGVAEKSTTPQFWRENVKVRVCWTVDERCGACGYQLYLSSSKRTCEAASKYRDSIKKGSLTFLSNDPSRFTEIHEVSCLPISLGRNGLKTKLMCRQCGVHIGYGYKDGHPAQCVINSRIGSARYKKIVVKIGALQPSDIVNEERTGSGQISEIVEIVEANGQNGASH